MASSPGTAIWVYCILVNNAGTGVVTLTNISFSLDGQSIATYEHEPDPSQATFLYDVPTLQRTGLSIGEHTLVMTAFQGSEASLLLFDYAVYT